MGNRIVRAWRNVDTDAVMIRPLDHTADVGFELVADSLEGLFTGAARGMFALIEGVEEDGQRDDGGTARESIEIACTGDDLAELLVAWLRELLWLHNDGSLVFRNAGFPWLDERALRARVDLAVASRPPVREIKGVTYHELVARRTGPRLHARIIFDV